MGVYTTIDNPELYFQVKLFAGTGTGGSTTAVTLDGSEDMAPDLVWVNHRNSAGNWKGIADTVRGVQKGLHSNTNAAEATSAEYLTAFGSDGFTVGENGSWGANSVNYVAYCWKAGTTSGINTTGADITLAAYSFNDTSKFSIIKYEGNDTADTQVPHGLGAVPKFGIFKKLESTGRYQTYHHALDTDEKLYLDDTHAKVTDADAWNETDPTSVNWTIDVEDDANESGEDLVAYSWAPVQGYSAFGSYIGNDQSSDNTFVYTGFRSAWIMIKNTANTYGWVIVNNKALGYNPDNNFVYANATDAESTNDWVDIYSNGFKIRSNTARVGSTGEMYVYAAFAEAPFVNSKGVPCNAR